MSEAERSALSEWLHSRYRVNGRAHRKLPCFVFVNHMAENHNGRDFTLNLSNGTAFIETRTALSAGQKVFMRFPNANNGGATEIMGEVIWIDPTSLDEKP